MSRYRVSRCNRFTSCGIATTSVDVVGRYLMQCVMFVMCDALGGVVCLICLGVVCLIWQLGHGRKQGGEDLLQ